LAKLRSAIVVVLCVLIAGAIAAGAWTLGAKKTSYLTDGSGIKERAADAPVRDVLWTAPERLDAPINQRGDDYEPRLTADGRTMFLVRGRAGDDANIYVSNFTDAGWSDPEPIDAINTAGDELGPSPSPDGRILYFYSDRAGGFGGYDLWLTRRTDDGWSRPENLGPTVNGPLNDYGPAIDPAGDTLYFASNRPAPGERDMVNPESWTATVREDLFRRHYDLYVSTMTERGWGAPKLLEELSGSFNEGAPAISPIGDFIYFASDRPGGAGGYDLYRARLTPDGFGPVASLGPPVNTSGNELDPALSLDGFVIHFSTDRTGLIEGGFADAGYDVYKAHSREVYRTLVTEGARVDWGALIGELWPWLLALALLLALLIIALLLLRDTRFRKRWIALSLLMQCLLLSVLLHALLAALFTAWHVKTRLEGLMDSDGGTRVALVSRSPGSGASGIASQVRGMFTEVVVTPTESADAPDAQTEAFAESREVASPDAENPTELSASRMSFQPKHLALATPEAPLFEVQAQQPEAVALTAPSSVPQTRVATRAAEAVMRAQPSASRATPAAEPSAQPAATRAVPTDLAATLPARAVRTNASLPTQTRSAPATRAVRDTPMPAAPLAASSDVRAPAGATPVRSDEAVVEFAASAPTPTAVASVPEASESIGGRPDPIAERAIFAPSRSAAAAAAPSPATAEASLPAAALALAAPELSLPSIINAPNTRIEGRDASTAEPAAAVRAAEASAPMAMIPNPERSADASAPLPAPTTSRIATERSASSRSETEIQAASPTATLALATPELELPSAVRAPSTRADDNAETADEPASAVRAAQASAPAALIPNPQRTAHAEAPMPTPTTSRVAASRSASAPALRDALPSASAVPDTPPALPTLGGQSGLVSALPSSAAPDEEPLEDESDLENARRLDLAGASDATPDLALFDGDRPSFMPAPPDPVAAQLEASRLALAGSGAAGSPGGIGLPQLDTRLPTLGGSIAAPLPTTPPEPDTLTVRGVVLDERTRRPLPGSTVRYDADGGEQVRVRADADGAFEISADAFPDVFAITAVRPGYEPGASEGTLAGIRRGRPVEILMTPESRFAVALEEEPRVHHLGNDSFSGSINSQFQRASEGEIYEATFVLAEDAAPPNITGAEVRMLLKGAQTSNPIWINGRRLPEDLTDSPRSGRYEEWTSVFPASWLRAGENTLSIRSVNDPGTDIDDFEFVNVRIIIERGDGGEAEI